MVRRIILFALVIQLTNIWLNAQQPPPFDQPDNRATVVVYRYRNYATGAPLLKPSVYCDERQLARIAHGTYFVVNVPAGKHVFRSNEKQSGIELNTEVGKTYFIRIDMMPAMTKAHGQVTLISPEQGLYEAKKLDKLSRGNIKDAELVDIDSQLPSH